MEILIVQNKVKGKNPKITVLFKGIEKVFRHIVDRFD